MLILKFTAWIVLCMCDWLSCGVSCGVSCDVRMDQHFETSPYLGKYMIKVSVDVDFYQL